MGFQNLKFLKIHRIRNFSIKEGKRKARIGDKVDKSTTDQAIDPKTKVILFKMINGGVLDGINGPPIESGVGTSQATLFLDGNHTKVNKIINNLCTN